MAARILIGIVVKCMLVKEIAEESLIKPFHDGPEVLLRSGSCRYLLQLHSPVED